MKFKVGNYLFYPPTGATWKIVVDLKDCIKIEDKKLQQYTYRFLIMNKSYFEEKYEWIETDDIELTRLLYSK